MSGTTWITDTIKELSLRTVQANTPVPSVTMTTTHTAQAPAAPKGSGKQRTPWGKMLAGMVYGSDTDRHGFHDVTDPDGKKQADRLAAAKVAIADQITRGTAASVAVQSAGGRQLSGNFYSAEGHNLRTANNNEPDKSRPVVLFLSGSGGTAEEYGNDIAEHYQESGASMLSVNFGGYGGSSGGAPTEESLLQDGQAMLQYLLDLGYTEDKIIIHGFSMGGAIGGVLAAHNEKKGMQLRGVMLDRPMVSVSGGIEAHGFDAVDEATDIGVLRGMGKGVVKMVSAAGRASVGKLSARKALTKQHSDTRIVVSGDQGRFEAQGAALRTKLQTRDPTRAVSGTASNASHLESDKMIGTNSADMQALIDTPPPGTPKQVRFQSGLSDTEKKSTRKLQARVETRITEIKNAVDAEDTKINSLMGIVRNPGPPLQANVIAYVNNNVPQIRNRLTQFFADVNEFATMDLSFNPNLELDIANYRRKLRRLENSLNEMSELAGGIAAYSPEAVRLELAYGQEALAAYNAMPNAARIGTSPKEQTVIKANALFAKMQTAGVTFAGTDATLVRDIQATARAIRTTLNTARFAATNPAPTQAPTLTRNSSAIGLNRRQARAQLTNSFS